MKKGRSFSWTELSRELKPRHVYTVVATYAVVSWVLLQVAEVTFGPLHLPEGVMSRLVVLVIIGFPIVVVLAWFFDLTREGIRLTPNLTPHSEEESDRPSIAVLPFADMSPERDQGYFCERGYGRDPQRAFQYPAAPGGGAVPLVLSTGTAAATCAESA